MRRVRVDPALGDRARSDLGSRRSEFRHRVVEQRVHQPDERAAVFRRHGQPERVLLPRPELRSVRHRHHAAADRERHRHVRRLPARRQLNGAPRRRLRMRILRLPRPRYAATASLCSGVVYASATRRTSRRCTAPGSVSFAFCVSSCLIHRSCGVGFCRRNGRARSRRRARRRARRPRRRRRARAPRRAARSGPRA